MPGGSFRGHNTVSIFTPLAYPYVRAQTYADANPPAVLSDEFYNPTQDALATYYGGLVGYSQTNSNEEFVRWIVTATPIVGDRIGSDLTVFANPGGGFSIASVAATGPNEHGVLQIYGTAAGGRGGAPGFRAGECPRNVGLLRWIMRVRVRCSNFAVLENAPPGLQIATGDLTSFNYPAWLADATTGFWVAVGQTAPFVTTVPTVDGEWITLWITLEEADGVCRWYYKRDADPVPVLEYTETLTVPSLVGMQRWLRYQVTAGAVGADNIELDSSGLCTQR